MRWQTPKSRTSHQIYSEPGGLEYFKATYDSYENLEMTQFSFKNSG